MSEGCIAPGVQSNRSSLLRLAQEAVMADNSRARLAFENFVRAMAADTDPLPRRLWDNFKSSVFDEIGSSELPNSIKVELDRFCIEFLGESFADLNSDFSYHASERLNDTTCLRAFERLMEIKDDLDRGAL